MFEFHRWTVWIRADTLFLGSFVRSRGHWSGRCNGDWGLNNCVPSLPLRPIKVGFFLWRERTADLCSFDLLAYHPSTQIAFASHKELVEVRSFVPAVAKAGESIEIELALEGCQLGLTKVLGHNVVDKLLGLVYDKASSVWLPRDDMLVAIRREVVQELMQLNRERSRDTSSGWMFFLVVAAVIVRVIVVVVLNDDVGVGLFRLLLLMLRHQVCRPLLRSRRGDITDIVRGCRSDGRKLIVLGGQAFQHSRVNGSRSSLELSSGT